MMTKHLLLVIPLMVALPAVKAAKETPSPSANPERIEAVFGDQRFGLAGQIKNGVVETNQFLLTGETPSNWTQMVTIQNIQSEDTEADMFVLNLRKNIEQEAGVAFEVLRQGKTSSVFTARLPKNDSAEDQVNVCLVQSFSGNLVVTQYALKPSRVDPQAMGVLLKEWRDRFLQMSKTAAKKK